MTLRVRLLLGLVVLAAIGLTVAGGVTYRQTRADLLGRVNQQLATSSQSPNLFFHGFDRSDENLTHALLPPGTWAQVRASGSGQILDTNPGVVSGASPALPATVKPGQIFTVDSPHYRVRAAQPRLYLVQDPSLGVQRGVRETGHPGARLHPPVDRGPEVAGAFPGGDLPGRLRGPDGSVAARGSASWKLPRSITP